MTDDELREVQRLLKGCVDFNNGVGLILPPSMAKRLRGAGIEGPFMKQPTMNVSADPLHVRAHVATTGARQ